MATIAQTLKETSKISVIIPTYNGAKYLSETLESVLAQTVSDWELIVVDDGSTDGTREVAQEYVARDGRIRLIAKDNGGESTARNRGYAASDPSRPYVIFLDHDDLWEPNALAVLRAALEADPDAVGAYGIGQFVAQDGTPTMSGELEAWCRLRKKLQDGRLIDCAPGEPTTLASIAYHPSIPTPGVCLLRRKRLPGGGELFSSALRHGSGDVHLWLRLARAGHFAFADKSLIRGRRHADNMTNKRKLISQSMHDAYADVAALPDTTAAQRKILRLAYRQWWSDNARGSLRTAAAALKHGKIPAAVKDFARAVRNAARSARGLPVRSSLSAHRPDAAAQVSP